MEIRRKKSERIELEIARAAAVELKDQEALNENLRLLQDAQSSDSDLIEINVKRQRVEESRQRDCQSLERRVLLNDERRITVNEVKILLKSRDFLQKRIHKCLSAIVVSPKSPATKEFLLQSPPVNPSAQHALIASLNSSSNCSSNRYDDPVNCDSSGDHTNAAIERSEKSDRHNILLEKTTVEQAGEKRSSSELQGGGSSFKPFKIARQNTSTPYFESRRSSWGAVPTSERNGAAQINSDRDNDRILGHIHVSYGGTGSSTKQIDVPIVDDEMDADMSIAEAKSDFQSLRGKFTEPPPGFDFKKKNIAARPAVKHVRPEIIKKIIKKNKQKKMEMHLQTYGAFRQNEISGGGVGAAMVQHPGFAAAARSHNPYVASTNLPYQVVKSER